MNEQELRINAQDYFEMPGLSVLVYHNTFSEGHQGGVEIIQHDNRVATGGNVRLSPSPGQWQPVPQIGEGFEKVGCSPKSIALHSREVDRERNEIRMPCSYPDAGRHRRGFNPLIYPDLELSYTVRVRAQGAAFTISVDLDAPLPADWVGRVGYNLELFPGNLYGRAYYMDGRPGTFPRQAAGPTYLNPDGEAEAVPLAEGHALVVAPACDALRMTIESAGSPLRLLDGSLKHNNGWFVVRSLIPAGATEGAVRWTITPHVISNYTYAPVVHLSQVGYHPRQAKVAYIELDRRADQLEAATLLRVLPSGEVQAVLTETPERWGPYLRYQYATFDFSEVDEPGVYRVRYGDDVLTHPFRIDRDIYERHVWQPTLEYFLPMQMCHMRVNQKYRVWHGMCHMDDALMAPLNINHFDGYDNTAETSTLAPFRPLEHVPGLAVGGWHDAGDDDLRLETQAVTTMVLALAYEAFDVRYDQTFVDQAHHHVEIHHPDGQPDLLQQVEHGVLTILAGYRQLGRLYRGIIVPTLRQYVHLGDPAAQTDNRVCDDAVNSPAADIDELWYKKVANRYASVFDPELNLDAIEVVVPDLDDRLVFTETNPGRQLYGATALAVAARVLPGYDDELAAACREVAEALWTAHRDVEGAAVAPYKLHLLAELLLTTGDAAYAQALCGMADVVAEHFDRVGWALGRVLPSLDCPAFHEAVTAAAQAYQAELHRQLDASPFGAPLSHVERVAFRYYFLHRGWPELFPLERLYALLNYLLGCRPGATTHSLVSGVGAESPVVAYGFNRADWSYIPGGTFWNAMNLVRPDFPEDKVWPFLWQEREYIVSGASMYMFAALAVAHSFDAPSEG